MKACTAEQIFFVHGRGDAPEEAPGDLLMEHGWGTREFVAPSFDADFYRENFEAQIERVDAMLGEAPLAMGFSFGTWLLLTVVAKRRLTEREVPELILLSPILGYGGTAAAGLVAPYAREVRRHLGLSEWAHWLPNNARARAPIVCPERIHVVHGTEDPHCATEDVRALSPLGYQVTIVGDGHRLESPEARIAIRRALVAASQRIA